MKDANLLFHIYSKTGRDISNFSQLGEKEILFSPGTQFIVCDSSWNEEQQLYTVYLREVNQEQEKLEKERAAKNLQSERDNQAYQIVAEFGNIEF